MCCHVTATSYVEARNTPETAHNNKLRGSTCERGFYKSHGKCLRVKVPHHGKLNALANGWACKRGFYKSGKRCIQVKVPKHGRLNYRGDDWTCKSGFFRAGDQCLQLRLNSVRQDNHIQCCWPSRKSFKTEVEISSQKSKIVVKI